MIVPQDASYRYFALFVLPLSRTHRTQIRKFVGLSPRPLGVDFSRMFPCTALGKCRAVSRELFVPTFLLRLICGWGVWMMLSNWMLVRIFSPTSSVVRSIKMHFLNALNHENHKFDRNNDETLLEFFSKKILTSSCGMYGGAAGSTLYVWEDHWSFRFHSESTCLSSFRWLRTIATTNGSELIRCNTIALHEI